MNPVKRIAHVRKECQEITRPNTKSTGTQTDPKELAATMKFTVSKFVLADAVDNNSDASQVEGDALNKACQTQNIGLKRPATMPLDRIKDADIKRKRLAIANDRLKLRSLLEVINADPPPPWHVASLMWLDVDVLERRIEAFEKEESDNVDKEQN